jgi:uncharacterized protein
MTYAQVKVKELGTVLAQNVLIADNLLTRMFGLMFQKSMGTKDGLLIDPCNSIHTFFMRFPIDVIFIGRNGKIVKILRDMKPWRMSWLYFQSSQVLEMNSGALPITLKEGMIIEVSHV